MIRIGGMLSQILGRPAQLTWDGIQTLDSFGTYYICFPCFRVLTENLIDFYSRISRKVDVWWILPFQSVLDRHICGSSNATWQLQTRGSHCGRRQTKPPATSAVPSGIEMFSLQNTTTILSLHTPSVICVSKKEQLNGENLYYCQKSVVPLPKVKGPQRPRGQDDLQGRQFSKCGGK